MTTRTDDARFAFGRNWASYAELIGERELPEAERGLLRLVPADALRGRSFVDIGCGSGLHAAAAARLGVRSVLALDFDPDSVATTRNVRARYAATVPWRAVQFDVLKLDGTVLGTFDIVYSWGVLHHTGDMWNAIRRAASLVEPDGLFAFSLYRRTRVDALWTAEKRWYAGASRRSQRIAQAPYISARRPAWAARGINHKDSIENYRLQRGMDFHHDVHDWLGGYPYETALPTEVERVMTAMGFSPERVFAAGVSWGLLGSACDEYVYRRLRAPAGEPCRR